MDPEFQRLVDAAAEVAATGQWDAVNERIKNLAASPGPDGAWHVQLLGCLCSRLFSEYLLLKRAYGDERERDSFLLAWPARNLLELTVWSLYCGKDRANARRLYEDAGRDVLGNEKPGPHLREEARIAGFSVFRDSTRLKWCL